MTGLIIGSLTPDFEYFIKMRIESNFSHTLGGMFWFDLPMGIALAFIFHHLVRNALFENLPVFLRARLMAFKSFSWNTYFLQHWWVVLVSILIGAASHILWDGFTHYNGFFVERIPVLTDTIYLFNTPLPLFKILQHGSTLLGGFIILFSVYRLPQQKVAKRAIEWRYWFAIGAIFSIIVAIRLCTGLDPRQYGNLIATAISATLLALTLAPFLAARAKG